ncbi:nucleotidyl transferase AbiEii/AbiGii toxin family protein [Bacteroidota bacterium]
MNQLIDIASMPENTRKVFSALSEAPFISDFTLVGGTALAIQIHHRRSEDLDFIYDGKKLNSNAIKRNMGNVFASYRIIRQDDNWQIDFVINDIRVTFFSAVSIALPFNVKPHSFGHKN